MRRFIALFICLCTLAGCSSARTATVVPRPATPVVVTASGAPKPASLSGCSNDPRVDQRSTPADFVRSYFNALNQHDYKRAYSYLTPLAAIAATPVSVPSGSPLALPDYNTWSNGYVTTACSILTYVGDPYPVADATPGFAGIGTGYAIPVSVAAVLNDGTIQLYTGVYAIAIPQGQDSTVYGKLVLGLSQLNPL